MKAKIFFDNVILKIFSSQTIDGETSSTELSTTGRLAEKNNGVQELTFKEFFSDGQSTHESLTVVTFHEQGRLSMVRQGVFNTELLFEENKRYTSLYNTPYGTLDLGVYTKLAKLVCENEEKYIELCYTLDNMGEIISENYIKFTIKKRNDKND